MPLMQLVQVLVDSECGGGHRSGGVGPEALEKDLSAVIALQGLPCGQVVAVEEKAESDVYLNAAGRVVVETRR